MGKKHVTWRGLAPTNTLWRTEIAQQFEIRQLEPSPSICAEPGAWLERTGSLMHNITNEPPLGVERSIPRLQNSSRRAFSERAATTSASQERFCAGFERAWGCFGDAGIIWRPLHVDCHLYQCGIYQDSCGMAIKKDIFLLSETASDKRASAQKEKRGSSFIDARSDRSLWGRCTFPQFSFRPASHALYVSLVTRMVMMSPSLLACRTT